MEQLQILDEKACELGIILLPSEAFCSICSLQGGPVHSTNAVRSGGFVQ